MGFPSPAADYAHKCLDIESLVVKHPAATYFLRAQTNAMKNDAITQGDIVIVDCSIKPMHGCMVVAILNGEFHLRRLCTLGKRPMLVASDTRIKQIPIDDLECTIFGVVTFSIKRQFA